MHLTTVLGECVPNDHARQATLSGYLEEYLGPGSRRGASVLDLGCGAGELVRSIEERYGGIRCVGVDIADSPEVRNRTSDDARFVTFDGVLLPFADEEFDFVVSRQVLEHVRRPEPLFAEVTRVLKPGGVFFGSTSQLEPYHSFSTYNYTPYGIMVLAESAGLKPLEFRPGADVLVVIGRRFFRRRNWIDRWLERESPLNRLIDLQRRVMRREARATNVLKLMLAGQFFFVLRKG